MIVERRSPGPRTTGNRRRRFPREPADRRWYGVRAGYQTGPIQGWQNCLRSVSGYEQAEYQRCFDRRHAQEWCNEALQSRPTTPLSQTGSFLSPTGLFSTEASSFSISGSPSDSASGSGGLFSNEVSSFSTSSDSASRPGGLFSPSTGSSSGSGGLFSGRTSSPDRSVLEDRLRTERNINTLQGLLRNLNIGETVSITRGEDEFDFMYTIGSSPRSLN